MAQFDPKLRRETRLLKTLFTDGKRGRPVYRMLPYALVEYDNDPDRYLEPLSIEQYGPNDRLTNPAVDGPGQIVGFEVHNTRPFPMFAYNDYDAASD